MYRNSETIGLGGTFSVRRVVAVAACAAALAACAKKENAATDTTAMGMRSDSGMTGMTDTAATMTGASTGATASGAAASGAATVPVTSDAEILSAIGMINSSEIGAAKLAENKATSADVKSFARDMVKDHTSMQGDVDKLAKSAKITPKAPSAATQMKQESAAQMDSLKSAKGATFDQQYIAAQVADHQKALDNLKSYQGSAQNADLKNLIQNAIPKVQQHLDRARDLQGKLGTKA